MNTTNPNSTSTRPLSRRAPILAAAASLLLAPCLHAQTPAPVATEAAATAAPAPAKGATITPLFRRADFDPDVLVFTATVSAGDSFPVQVEGQPKVFDVKVKTVSADRLEIDDIDSRNATTVFIERGSAYIPRVGGFDYEFAYPEGDKTTLTIRRVPWNSVIRTATERGLELYTMRFDGGEISELSEMLGRAFPKDSVVVSEPSKGTKLPRFDLRNVRLAEIGRTLEFLSEGRLSVEVAENAGAGNIWRIGRKNAAEAAASVKMRSVAAPHLFADEEKLKNILQSAEEMEMRRFEASGVRERARGEFRPANVRPLKSQGIFVIIGDEDGVAGVESLIKAAEQLAMAEAAKKEALAESLAPKMRSVLAPHLFNNEARLDRAIKEFENTQALWSESHDDLMKMIGSNDRRGGVCVQQRPDQKLFVLIGSEEGIAGMESVIQAAEKNAADEDAKLSAAKAVIEDLEQQLRLAEGTLVQERNVMMERRKNLQAEREERTKAWEIQLRDAHELSPEKRAELIAEKDAALKNIEKMLDEGDSKSIAQMEQLSRVINETQMRLEAARSKAQK